MNHQKSDSTSVSRRTGVKTSGSIAATVLILLLLTGSLVNAAEIYTWIDDNGMLTITDRPPPEGVQPRHIIRYTNRSEKEQQQDLRRNQETDQDPLQQQKVSPAQTYRNEAEAARKDAEAAIRRAQEAEQNLIDYMKKYGAKNKNEKIHRSRIENLAKTARSARAQADEAIKRSNQAAKKSWEADKMTEETASRP